MTNSCIVIFYLVVNHKEKFMAKVISGLLSDSNVSTNEIILYVALGLVALLLTTVVILLVLRSKKKNAAKDETVATTAATQPKKEKAPAPAPIISVVVPAGQSAQASTAPVITQQTTTVKVESKPQVREVGDGRVVNLEGVEVIYNKSLTAKLCQGDEDARRYYDELKSELLSYKGVKSRMSWKHESFRKGRVLIAKLRIRGKKLCIYLPLNALDYEDTKYKVEYVGDVKANEETPCAYMIKNDRRCGYAKELIAVVMGNQDVEQGEVVVEKHSKQFPYDTTESLIRRQLIKLVYGKTTGEETVVTYVTAEEVGQLMTDEEAKQSVVESARFADRTKVGIVNVDVLSKNFSAGDKVTLEEIKKRVPGFNKKVTFVKVLARGLIDKALTVEADDFSLDAVKMIVLMGGQVIRTRKK